LFYKNLDDIIINIKASHLGDSVENKIKNYDIHNIDFLPIAISVSQVMDGKLNYISVSQGFCELFKLDYENALYYLNNTPYGKVIEDDKFWLYETEYQLVNNNLLFNDYIYRTKIGDNNNISYINVNFRKRIIDNVEYIFTSFNLLTSDSINNNSVRDIIKSQQIKILDDSLNAIIILSKKDFSIKYLNKAALEIVKKPLENIDSKKCYEYFRNQDKPCSFCPLINNGKTQQIIDVDYTSVDKKVQVYFTETTWNGEDAYVEYLRDVTSEKKIERLFNLYKSLVSYKRNSDVDVGALYCFDLETEKTLFYFLHSTKANHENAPFNEVINYFYPTIIGEEDRKKYLEFYNLERIKENAKKYITDSVEYHQKVSSTVTVFLRASYNFLEDPLSKHTLLIVNVYDVTQKIEMEKMLDAIVTEQNEFVMRQDDSTKTCIVFARANNFLNFPVGYSRYSYKEYEDYIHNGLKDKLIETYGNKRVINCEERNEFIKNESYSVTYVLKIDGKIYHKRSLGFRSKDNSLFTVIYDVTDLALAERKKNEKLKNVNKRLVVAQKQANISSKAKSEFLSRMSHDMRTPLGAIISLSSFGIEDSTNSNFFEYFKQIKENGDYLLSLVNDILDFQKIEIDSIVLEEKICKFSETAQAIQRIVKQRALEKHIDFKCSFHKEIESEFVILDKKRMKQVLVNLLNNSIKYTKPGGKVYWDLVVKKDEKGDVIAVHTISDSGVGMSEDFMKIMYEPFSKELNELSDKEGGTGLGLVISKKIIDAMNGKIECISKIGKGTTFIITLPRKIPTEQQINDYKNSKNKTIDYDKLIGLKILVCEDVEINRVIIKRLLEQKGTIVELAKDGIEGVRLAKENHYDVILMDIRMPKLDGLSATKEIRKFNKNIPIIALSANAFSLDKRISKEAGMNAHIAKPINKDELFTTIISQVNNK